MACDTSSQRDVCFKKVLMSDFFERSLIWTTREELQLHTTRHPQGCPLTCPQCVLNFCREIWRFLTAFYQSPSQHTFQNHYPGHTSGHTPDNHGTHKGHRPNFSGSRPSRNYQSHAKKYWTFHQIRGPNTQINGHTSNSSHNNGTTTINYTKLNI